MKTVYLVDDEPLVTETIQSLVDWNCYGMELCGMANDGICAREEILAKKPDLVITDIRMPGLNGLDLIAQVQPQLSRTRFVIISGYNDFSYIRAAVRLNVIDYLDKPVTVEKIESMLEHAREMMAENDLDEEKEEPGQSSEEAAKVLRYCLESAPDDEIALYAQRIYFKSLFVVAFAGDWEFCRCFIPGILKDVFSQEGIRYVDAEKPDEELLICWSAHPVSSADLQKAMSEKLAGYFADGSLTSVGISACYDNLYNLRTAGIEAACALRYAEFFGDEILDIRSVNMSQQQDTGLIQKDQILLALRIGDWDRAEAIIRRVLDLIEKIRPDPDVVRHVCLEIIYLCGTICAETGTDYRQNGRPFLPHKIIVSMNREYEIRKWTLEVVRDMIRWLKEKRSQAARKDILIAKKYIDEHYQEAITLRSLADMCFMNPNYFSGIFRDTVGKTYVKYLNTVRMEHAKEMLCKGGKIRDISVACGFQDTRYFSGRFKSYTGVTPEQYRNIHREK